MEKKTGKSLRPLLPVCAYCRKTRNSKGGWEQVEMCVINNSRAELTHGICPECMIKIKMYIRALGIT
jgi:hypothetical protein